MATAGTSSASLAYVITTIMVLAFISQSVLASTMATDSSMSKRHLNEGDPESANVEEQRSKLRDFDRRLAELYSLVPANVLAQDANWQRLILLRLILGHVLDLPSFPEPRNFATTSYSPVPKRNWWLERDADLLHRERDKLLRALMSSVRSFDDDDNGPTLRNGKRDKLSYARL